MGRIDRFATDVRLDELEPCRPELDDTAIAKHMDHCVAVAVRLGVCEGAALAAHASVMDLHPHDLAQADRALVLALREILGISTAFQVTVRVDAGDDDVAVRMGSDGDLASR